MSTPSKQIPKIKSISVSPNPANAKQTVKISIYGTSKNIEIASFTFNASNPVVLDKTLNLSDFSADEELKIKISCTTHSNWYFNISFTAIFLTD